MGLRSIRRTRSMVAGDQRGCRLRFGRHGDRLGSERQNTVTMPGQLAQMAAAAAPLEVSVPELPVDVAEAAPAAEQSLDFDLRNLGTGIGGEDKPKSDLVSTVTRKPPRSPDDADGSGFRPWQWPRSSRRLVALDGRHRRWSRYKEMPGNQGGCAGLQIGRLDFLPISGFASTPGRASSGNERL